jgi:hypothetical protein
VFQLHEPRPDGYDGERMWVEVVEIIAPGRYTGKLVSGSRRTAGGYPSVLESSYDLPVDEFVLDFAARDVSDVDVLRDLPDDKGIAAGVVDVRDLEVEQPEQIAERIRRVLEVVPASASRSRRTVA